MNSFLQSKLWADFQKSLNRKAWHKNGVWIFKYDLPLNKSYLYSPHCGDSFLSESFLDKIKKIAKSERAIFFKIEPVKINKHELKKFGFKKSKNIQPPKTLILDIENPKDKLLKQMHSKTRYNIRLAQKKGVKIKKDKNKFEDFWRLIQKTTKRDKFKSHPKQYYKKMLEIPGIELFIAKLDSKIIASNIVMFYKNTGYYLHGVSDYNYRKYMAPHLLQWEQILEAQKTGCSKYDFWGIDQKKWPGVTRFKKGFGGKETVYSGAYDLAFNLCWYKLYKIGSKIF